VLQSTIVLAILSGTLARPQYTSDPRLEPPPSSDDPRQPQTVDYTPEDLEEVANRKRNYQAAFATLASQMAAQSHIFEEAQTPVQPLAIQTNVNLYHRSPVVRREPRFHQTHRVNRVVPLNPARVLYPEEENRGTYIYHRIYHFPVESVKSSPAPSVSMTVDFLQDTPEVAAARRDHLAAVERARRRHAYVTIRRHAPSDPHRYTSQIYQ
jgi:hypothetical protein